MPGIKHAFVSGKAAAADATLVDGPDWDAEHKSPPFAVCLVATLVGITNVPAALNELGSGNRHRTKVELADTTQVRVTASITTVANAGCGLRIQYSTDQTTWAYLDGTSGPEAIIDALGCRVSSWVNLETAAKADVFLRAITINGDAVADPGIGNVNVQFK